MTTTGVSGGGVWWDCEYTVRVMPETRRVCFAGVKLESDRSEGMAGQNSGNGTQFPTGSYG